VISDLQTHLKCNIMRGDTQVRNATYVRYVGNTFCMSWFLNVHMLSHTGEKPYSCNVRGAVFTCKSALRNVSSFPWLWGHSTVCNVTSHFLCIYSFTTVCNFIHVHSNMKAVPWSSLHMFFSPNTYRHMRRAAVEGIPCWGLLWKTLANRSLIYPSHSGRYRAEGCMTMG